MSAQILHEILIKNPLKDCPFCGSEVGIHLNYRDEIKIDCNKCSAEMWDYVLYKTRGLENIVKELIAEWNRRVDRNGNGSL